MSRLILWVLGKILDAMFHVVWAIGNLTAIAIDWGKDILVLLFIYAVATIVLGWIFCLVFGVVKYC